MQPDCECGHSGNRHEGEMPYPCYDCECQRFKADFGMTTWTDGTPVETNRGIIDFHYNLGHHTAGVEEQTRQLTAINKKLDDILLEAKTLWSEDEFKAMIARAKERLDAMQTGEAVNFEEITK